MHRVKPHKKKEVHFLIFGSVFHRAKYIHTTFDLKGSSHGRSATEADKNVAQPVFKDNDFLEKQVKIEIPAAKAKLFRAQVEKDVEVQIPPTLPALVYLLSANVFVSLCCLFGSIAIQFLRNLNIMDYSMLLGVHDSRRGFVASSRKKNGQNGAAQQPAAQQGAKPTDPPKKSLTGATTSADRFVHVRRLLRISRVNLIHAGGSDVWNFRCV